MSDSLLNNSDVYSKYIQLKPHQIIPIKHMQHNRGILLYHSTGSGKTLTALLALYQFEYDIVIIGPKNSKKTFDDNIKKANLDPSRFTFYSYTKIKKKLADDVTYLKNNSVIVDEAHTIRNENIYNLYIISALQLCHKVVLATATPIINHMSDISPLINIVHGEDIMPTDKLLFDKMFYDEEKMELINTDLLRTKMENTISYYRVDDDDNYPKFSTHYIETEMNHAQIDEYIYYIRKVIYEDRENVDTNMMFNIDYAMLPNKKKNFFLNVTRQISNTVKNSPYSPKIEGIYNKILEGPYPIIVYSNFLKNGVYTLAILLDENKISYKLITGYTTNDKLNLIVNNYNDGLFKVLLISSAGSESLNLRKTRQIHVMEPHWNEARINQVIGRAIRYKSHEELPIDERHVDIYRWLSILPKQIKNLSADQFLVQLSRTKLDLAQKFTHEIQRSSIEKNHMLSSDDNYKLSKINSTNRSHGNTNNNDAHWHKYRKYRSKYKKYINK